MFYLLIGGVILLFLFSGRGRTLLNRDGWRVGAGVLAIVAFAGAAYAFIRGAWEAGVVLAVVGLWSATSARQRPQRPRATPPREDPSLAEARSILGVGPQASRADILAAYGRLIRLAHPDKGGTAGLAAQLNTARDRLLREP